MELQNFTRTVPVPLMYLLWCSTYIVSCDHSFGTSYTRQHFICAIINGVMITNYGYSWFIICYLLSSCIFTVVLFRRIILSVTVWTMKYVFCNYLVLMYRYTIYWFDGMTKMLWLVMLSAYCIMSIVVYWGVQHRSKLYIYATTGNHGPNTGLEIYRIAAYSAY